MSERLGDAPIQDEYHEQMNTIVRLLDEAFNGPDRTQPRSTGFILLVFPFNNHEGRCNYRNYRYAQESKRACEATYPKDKFRVVAYDSTK